MDASRLYSGYRWLMLLSVSTSILSITTEMVGFAPILGEIAKDLNVSMGSATNLMMAFVLANAFVLTWGGVVCDKYGITKALILGLLCCSVPSIFMPWIGHSFKTVFICRWQEI